ncbi:hypothetical protein GCM10010330_05920 [Streptomyces tendae]|uniref:hypothetical protein n=1 Tax=Streptomyces tendae TaxID=1932 RepID=UPI001677360E|nr:hypothetical protein [Streptomyces tendae]GHA57089.1 hypothetical protein GCM10010330_05920 [Streptomyces tendae]
MTTPRILLDESVKDLRAELWFAEPHGFMPMPLNSLLAEPGSSDADAMREAVAPLLDGAPSELVRQRFVAQLALGQRMLGELCGFGTVYCSVGLHRDDIDPRSAHLLSLFTISWRDTKVASRGVTAARAATSAKGHTHITFDEFPCGPAVLSENTLRYAAESGLPQFPLLQVHAHLPHPDCKRLVVLTISSTAVARREEYRALLRGIVETVRFEDPMRVAS